MMTLPTHFELREVLKSAASIIRGIYDSGSTVSYKENGMPLTAADIRTSQFLERELSRLFPAAGWLSEESVDDAARLAHDWVWIVDPLDGTKEFVVRIPEFAISIGLVHKQNPVLGGVMNPVTGEGGVGQVGGHAEFWGFPEHVASAKRLADATASVSRTEVDDGSIVPYLPLVGHARPVGSVAYKLLRVAAGIDDLTFSVQHKSEWDVCGGVALLGAVDKVYRRFDGEPIRFNQRDIRIRCGAVAGDETLVTQFLRKVEQDALRSGIP